MAEGERGTRLCVCVCVCEGAPRQSRNSERATRPITVFPNISIIHRSHLLHVCTGNLQRLIVVVVVVIVVVFARPRRSRVIHDDVGRVLSHDRLIFPRRGQLAGR